MAASIRAAALAYLPPSRAPPQQAFSRPRSSSAVHPRTKCNKLFLRSRVLAPVVLRRTHVQFRNRAGPPRFSVIRASAVSTDVTDGTWTVTDEWRSFSSAVSGEWEGYASDFCPDGTPVELPEAAIPQAFRDWGLALFAWQSKASTLAKDDGSVLCSTKRFMPAVACDSLDPPVFSTQEEEFGLGASSGAMAFRPDGSFALAWPGKSTLTSGSPSQQGKAVVRTETQPQGDPSVFELEHCLVAEDPSGDCRARVRVIQQFQKSVERPLPVLQGLTLYRERWTGEYDAGDRGEEAAGSGTSFAEGPPVGLEAVEGRWLATKMSCTFSENSALGPIGAVVELSAAGTEELSRHLSEEGAILLPQGVWSRVLKSPSGGMILKAGWLVEADKAIVSRFDYTADGLLEAITISTETRISQRP